MGKDIGLIRNIKENRFTEETGSLDLEFYSSKLESWVPYTTRPDSPSELGKVVIKAINILVDSGQQTIAEYVPDTEEEVLSLWRDTVTCTPLQMRLYLSRNNLLTTVESIAATDTEAQLAWEYASVMQRNSPFIEALKVGNGVVSFTDEEIDEIFEGALEVYNV